MNNPKVLVSIFFVVTRFLHLRAEEAYATVTEIAYLGSQEISDPQHPTGPTICYQARFYAQVILSEFVGQYEIVARRCVEPSQNKLAKS